MLYALHERLDDVCGSFAETVRATLDLIPRPDAFKMPRMFDELWEQTIEKRSDVFNKRHPGGAGPSKNIFASIDAHEPIGRKLQLKAYCSGKSELASQHEHEIGMFQKLVHFGNVAAFAVEAKCKRMIFR